MDREVRADLGGEAAHHPEAQAAAMSDIEILRQANAVIADRQDFPDHHHLADDEIADLLARAEKQGLQLVTTAKDSVRLTGGHGRSEELREKSRVVDVDMLFDDPKAPGLIIDRAIEDRMARGRAVTPEEMLARPVWKRLRDAAARLLLPYL